MKKPFDLCQDNDLRASEAALLRAAQVAKKPLSFAQQMRQLSPQRQVPQ